MLKTFTKINSLFIKNINLNQTPQSFKEIDGCDYENIIQTSLYFVSKMNALRLFIEMKSGR
ncbi:CLUMA_CG010154, isoform A [Clunio marinus]|uniref:CLUMA_CG010154, isoform A n=1 Tax=Clunio marinus TaxID=568069 RepID=A0A1J1I875_9DIPT|nr:CLUMA_CG010154, isoform A [Clunio marinus]